MDFYVNLTYDQYKDLEMQCKSFLEGVHGDGTDYYHKSFAIYLGDTRIEFHGPNVKARKAEAEIDKANPIIWEDENPQYAHGDLHSHTWDQQAAAPKPLQRSPLEDALRRFFDAGVTIAYR